MLAVYLLKIADIQLYGDERGLIISDQNPPSLFSLLKYDNLPLILPLP